MPRAAATADVFNAIAESKRRQILEYLAPGEYSVGDIASALGLGQPSVSKHLQILRQVDLVRPRRDGKRTLYRTNADALRPVHDWSVFFTRYWRRQLVRIKEHAERRNLKSNR